MKTDKKNKTHPFWHQSSRSPNFLKNLFTRITLGIIFIIVVILAWKQYTNTPFRDSVILPCPSSIDQEQTQANSRDLKSISGRLAALETKTVEVEQSLPNPHKLIAMELLRGVLDGMIHLESLRSFLQKTSEPWANDLLTTLSPIKEAKTYAQLEALLVLPPKPVLFSWQGFKNAIKSFIHLRKLDGNNETTTGQLEDIRKALQAHDIQKALEIFKKLPPEDKAQLASWEKLFESRLLVELCAQKLLLELAGS